MEEKRSAALMDHCGEVEDPRIDRHQEHKLLDLLVIAICAIVCGANDWVAGETFGKANREGFQRFLELPPGMPSHDTVGRVFAVLAPEQWQVGFLSWLQAVAPVTAGQVVASDGKPLRRSYERRSARAAIPMVSAWAPQNRGGLGQLKTEEKANESPAIPALLKMVDVPGGIVTIDARGWQKTRAQQIVDQGADYLLALQPNQGTLSAAVEQWFQTVNDPVREESSLSYDEPEEQPHGRVEIRRHWTAPVPAGLPPAEAWAQLASVGRGESERPGHGEVTIEQRDYLASLASEAPRLAQAVRAQWGIENCGPWVLEVAFREDDSRVRSGHAPENLAVLRPIALNLLRQDTRTKLGIQNQRLKAGWDDTYLATLVFGRTV
jgi:predicted transposase YbfD/YdcC